MQPSNRSDDGNTVYDSRLGTQRVQYPSMTTSPLTSQIFSNSTKFFSGISFRTTTRALTESPRKTGFLNLICWLTYNAPGPGKRVPTSVEIKLAEMKPWAIRVLNRVYLAKSSFRWIGQVSPERPTNIFMSASEIVLPQPVDMPSLRSSKQ